MSWREHFLAEKVYVLRYTWRMLNVVSPEASESMEPRHSLKVPQSAHMIGG